MAGPTTTTFSITTIMAPNLDRIRKMALPFFTKTAHISAPFITTFLLIHLSAPALANLGGSSLSSQTMVSSRCLVQRGQP